MPSPIRATSRPATQLSQVGRAKTRATTAAANPSGTRRRASPRATPVLPAASTTRAHPPADRGDDVADGDIVDAPVGASALPFVQTDALPCLRERLVAVCPRTVAFSVG